MPVRISYRVDKPNQIVTVDLKDYDSIDPKRRYIYTMYIMQCLSARL